MAVDYKCPACDLRISTGRYHYHKIDAGYGGRSLLACSACGTQHAIELALPNRGPEFYAVHKLVIESLPESAVQRATQWIRREQNPISLEAALKIARNPPFTLFKATWEERATKVAQELQALGAKTHVSTVEFRPNPTFGPLQSDRLLFHSEPRRGSQRPEWLSSDDSVSNLQSLRCKHCQRVGTLVEEFDEPAPCPACKASLVIESTWIT